MKQQPNELPVSLKNTTAITTESGSQLFEQKVLLRKVSKFVTGQKEDGIIPIPVFIDPETGKIVKDFVPLDLREELKDQLI